MKKRRKRPARTRRLWADPMCFPPFNRKVAKDRADAGTDDPLTRFPC
jgi:hypothetical protein